jgi:hypothetical protein
MPHPPQFAGSVASSTHSSLHAPRPGGQSAPELPAIIAAAPKAMDRTKTNLASRILPH